MEFKDWALYNSVSLHRLFPDLHFDTVAAIDMSVGSDFFGNDPTHQDHATALKRIQDFQKKQPTALLANGYLEMRSFYNTSAYEREANGIKEFRNIHLGTDFWVDAGTPVYACWPGEVVISHDNDYHKDYGPTLVIKHVYPEIEFYTLYGHLSRSSLDISRQGKSIKAGTLLGYIGTENENGRWLPHLHFQLITDLQGATENYNGVAFPSELNRWKQLCPDPDLVFTEHLPSAVR